MSTSTGQSRRVVALGAVVLGVFVVPLGLRAVNMAVRPPNARPTYLPSLESPRERAPFDDAAVAALREADSDYILIGDSMAGTRVDPRQLSRLVGGHGAAALFHPASTSAYWYLTFKNFVVGPGLRPKVVIFFFRDEQLTNPLSRLYPGSLDRVAHDREPFLDNLVAARSRGTYYRLHLAVSRLYQCDETRRWLEPRLIRAPVAWSVRRRARKTLLDSINNKVFALEALRPMAAADMAAASNADLDFDRNVGTSVLPEIMRLSRTSGIKVAFIRVQRRPTAHGPPPQSLVLQTYVARLRRYLETSGALFHDDWGDPDQPLSAYADGDHIARDFRRTYTDILVAKNPEIFR